MPSDALLSFFINFNWKDRVENTILLLYYKLFWMEGFPVK